MSKPSKEVKKQYSFKKYIKEHIFEFLLDIIGPVVIVFIILKLTKSGELLYGIGLAFSYSIGKTIYRLHTYKKEME